MYPLVDISRCLLSTILCLFHGASYLISYLHNNIQWFPSHGKGRLPYEALKASALTLVSQRWTNFCSMVWQIFWINFGIQLTLRHTTFRISKKIVVCNHSFLFRQLLVPKDYKILAYLTEVKKVPHNMKWVSSFVSKLWRFVLECWVFAFQYNFASQGWKFAFFFLFNPI